MRNRKRDNLADHSLHQRLRAEAQRSRPAFSADLHDHIMRSVAKCQPFEKPRRRLSPSMLGVLATAAAVLVAVGTSRLWPTAEPPVVDPVSAVAIANDQPDTPRTSAIAQPKTAAESQPNATDDLYEVAAGKMDQVKQVDMLVESMLIDEQVAALDHDARMAADWLLDPLTLAFAE